MNTYNQLKRIKKTAIVELTTNGATLAVCPDMGGRIFGELAGISLHRIDLDCTANPSRPFNNFGGANFWPAPEGGLFGFNYQGNQWVVQPAINNQPFEILSCGTDRIVLQKHAKLVNRHQTAVEVVMKREVNLLASPSPQLGNLRPRQCLAYQTADSFEVLNTVTTDQALLAAWTLDQFDATSDRTAFVIVENPRNAINFDFYDHPGSRIQYFPKGFTYQTDGRARGQIGIRRDAQASAIGFIDPVRRLLCLRENRGPDDGLFFNIADNDQSGGPYSAADNYSIFNSDTDMNAFELETVGSARVEDNRIVGSRLVSATTFAVFDRDNELTDFIRNSLGA